ncbi:MAG: hypothetical protein ACFFD4_07815, partial [Candidatus Odinarchaeota archaeon]
MKRIYNKLINTCTDCPAHKMNMDASGSYCLLADLFLNRVNDNLFDHNGKTYEGDFPDWCHGEDEKIEILDDGRVIRLDDDANSLLEDTLREWRESIVSKAKCDAYYLTSEIVSKELMQAAIDFFKV